MSDYYGTNRRKYCMIVGPVSHCNIICAHIWPKHTIGKGLETFDLEKDNINNPRNFLRLHKSIEEAFDKKQLYFVHESKSPDEIKLVVRVICPTLLTETYEVNQIKYTFAALNGRESHFTFSSERKPYFRLLAAHASKAIERAGELDWIDAGDLPARRNRALELARLSLDPISANIIF